MVGPGKAPASSLKIQSVIGIINGVFIQETFKVAENDDHLLLMQKERGAKLHAKKMEKFIAILDEDCDGPVLLKGVCRRRVLQCAGNPTV